MGTIAWPFQPLRMGRLFGIPILLTPSVLLIVGLVLVWAAHAGGIRGFVDLSLLFGLLAVSLLAHELGHALLARRLGVAVYGISISPLHGATQLEGLALRPPVEAAVSLAGPAVNLVLCGIAALVPHPLAREALWINLVLAAGNLIPAFPTDGGRTLRAWFARCSPLPDATRAALAVSNLFLVALLAAAWHFDAFLLGLLLAVQLYFHGRMELARAVLRSLQPPRLSLWQVLVRSFHRAPAAPQEAPPAHDPAPPAPDTAPYGESAHDAPEPAADASSEQERLERFHGSLDEFFGRGRSAPPR